MQFVELADKVQERFFVSFMNFAMCPPCQNALTRHREALPPSVKLQLLIWFHYGYDRMRSQAANSAVFYSEQSRQTCDQLSSKPFSSAHEAIMMVSTRERERASSWWRKHLIPL